MYMWACVFGVGLDGNVGCGGQTIDQIDQIFVHICMQLFQIRQMMSVLVLLPINFRLLKTTHNKIEVTQLTYNILNFFFDVIEVAQKLVKLSNLKAKCLHINLSVVCFRFGVYGSKVFVNRNIIIVIIM